MKKYTIRFVEPRIFLAILLGGTVLCLGGTALVPKNIDISKIICIVWACAWGAVGYFLVKKVATRQIVVTLTTELLLIQSSGEKKEMQIPLNQITSYAYNNFNDNKTLRFHLRSGRKIVLKHQGALCANDDIETLANDFERQRLQLSAVDAGYNIGIRREKPFFEKRVSTILLACFTIVIGDLLWVIIYENRPLRGGFFGAISGYITYVAAWWATREKRS